MEIVKIIAPYFSTLLVGGLGYLFVYYFWEPIRKMDNQKQEIIAAITRYANVRQHTKMRKNNDYDGPGELYEEELLNQSEVEQTTHELRRLAGELRSIINAKKTYSLLSFLRIVPPKSRIETAARCLVGWANSIGQEDRGKLVGKFINDLAQALEIPIN